MDNDAPAISSTYLPPGPPELIDLVERAHREHPGVHELAPTADSDAVWHWFNTSGYIESEEVRQVLPPVPPRKLMDIVSVGGLFGFLQSGYASFAILREVLARRNDAFGRSHRILDFGCGSGRTIRCLLPYAATPRPDAGVARPGSEPPLSGISGSDTNAQAIQWCREHLGPARFYTNDVVPPLPFDSGAFDLIYSISVFSHLAEENHLGWIAELARVCRPKGLVILTKHGPHAIDRLLQERVVRKAIGFSKWNARKAQKKLGAEGFHFVRLKRHDHVVDTRFYGQSFISDDYVDRHWTPQFKVVERLNGRLEDWQDVVVLERT